MQWTWDQRKAAANLRKHGIPFSLAVLALDDPFALTEPDPHPDGDRWNILCQINGRTLFVVVSWSGVTDDDVGRIISARKTTSGERKRYADEQR